MNRINEALDHYLFVEKKLRFQNNESSNKLLISCLKKIAHVYKKLNRPSDAFDAYNKLSKEIEKEQKSHPNDNNFKALALIYDKMAQLGLNLLFF